MPLKIFTQKDTKEAIYKVSWWEKHTYFPPDPWWRKALRRLPYFRNKLKNIMVMSKWEHRTQTIKCENPKGLGYSFGEGKTVYIDDVSIIEVPDVERGIKWGD